MFMMLAYLKDQPATEAERVIINPAQVTYVRPHAVVLNVVCLYFSDGSVIDCHGNIDDAYAALAASDVGLALGR